MKTIMQRYRQYPFFVLLLIILWMCHGFFGLFHVSRIFFIIYFLGFCITYRQCTPFSKPILLLFISMVLSMISCWFFHGQSFINSINSYINYSTLAIYFILLKLKINPYVVERLLVWTFVIFCFCYIYQVLVFPKLIFLESDERLSYNASILLRRIRFPGMSVVGLGFFFFLNKVLLKKYEYFPFLILSLIIILLFGFRTLLFFCFIFGMYLNVKINGINHKFIITCIVFFVVIALIFITEFGQEIFGAMWERQTEMDQSFANEDYIRYVTLFYYLGEHFTNFIEFLLGSGFPARNLNSQYANYYEYIESNLGIHYNDWGILGVSWMMGVLSLVAMVWYPVKSFFMKLPKDKLYLNIWFAYLLACGFTSAEFIRQGCFLIQGLALYLIYSFSTYEKNNINK